MKQVGRHITFNIESLTDNQIMLMLLEVDKERRLSKPSEVKLKFLTSTIMDEMVKEFPNIKDYLVLFDTSNRQVLLKDYKQ